MNSAVAAQEQIRHINNWTQTTK